MGFLDSVARGVGGLVGGSIHSLSIAWDTIVGTLQAWLPGPLFPIVLICAALGLVWLFRKTIL
jgi:hypothetical protein